MNELNELLDDAFHGAAFAAYLEEFQLAQSHPCPTKVRARAYRYYEDALKEKNAKKAQAEAVMAGTKNHPARQVLGE